MKKLVLDSEENLEVEFKGEALSLKVPTVKQIAALNKKLKENDSDTEAMFEFLFAIGWPSKFDDLTPKQFKTLVAFITEEGLKKN